MPLLRIIYDFRVMRIFFLSKDGNSPSRVESHSADYCIHIDISAALTATLVYFIDCKSGIYGLMDAPSNVSMRNIIFADDKINEILLRNELR